MADMATCPECGQQMPVVQGKIRAHKNPNGPGQCAGSHTDAAEESSEGGG